MMCSLQIKEEGEEEGEEEEEEDAEEATPEVRVTHSDLKCGIMTVNYMLI